ncbi:unnamed protein product [Paramecium sonneborni]|uniref:Uncharacterized protein n=1 Tax=Paramecium sonneborni TaxID=65129 RepID=A0A8S1PIF2_9CILI|nr:unnamed protein product [Paramecium sonneborni]
MVLINFYHIYFCSYLNQQLCGVVELSKLLYTMKELQFLSHGSNLKSKFSAQGQIQLQKVREIYLLIGILSNGRLQYPYFSLNPKKALEILLNYIQGISESSITIIWAYGLYEYSVIYFTDINYQGRNLALKFYELNSDASAKDQLSKAQFSSENQLSSYCQLLTTSLDESMDYLGIQESLKTRTKFLGRGLYGYSICQPCGTIKAQSDQGVYSSNFQLSRKGPQLLVQSRLIHFFLELMISLMN